MFDSETVAFVVVSAMHLPRKWNFFTGPALLQQHLARVPGLCDCGNRDVLRAPQKKTIQLFLTREARYDFEFSLANASEND